MKKLISTLSILLFLGTVGVSAQCCNSAANQQASTKTTCCSQKQNNSEVKAYYFHGTHRCATCQAVEAVSKETIKELYGDKVTFESINKDVEKENPLIKKYEVSGQSLLIVKGDQKVNLTNVAFLNARTNPDKLKGKLKTTIDSMM